MTTGTVSWCCPFAARERAPGKVAILGNAAGTTARAMGHFFPGASVDAVEIDSELTRLGRRWFDLRNPRMTVHHEDARPFLRRSEGGYDSIFVDVYRQPYIPFYLTTREFFALARDRLRPGGSVVVNVGHPEGQDKLEKALTATMRTAFPSVARDPVEDTNTLLVASQSLSRPRLVDAAGRLPAALTPVARASAARLAPPLTGGPVYTDDRAPVEWLVDRSIVDYAAVGRLGSPRGSRRAQALRRTGRGRDGWRLWARRGHVQRLRAGGRARRGARHQGAGGEAGG